MFENQWNWRYCLLPAHLSIICWFWPQCAKICEGAVPWVGRLEISENEGWSWNERKPENNGGKGIDDNIQVWNSLCEGGPDWGWGVFQLGVWIKSGL